MVKNQEHSENIPKDLNLMLDKLHNRRDVLPEYSLYYARTIQYWGNAGSHYREQPLSPEDIDSALVAFNRLMRWFFKEYRLPMDPSADLLLFSLPQGQPADQPPVPTFYTGRIRLRILIWNHLGQIQFLSHSRPSQQKQVFFDASWQYYEALFDQIAAVVGAVNNLPSHMITIDCQLPDGPQLCAPEIDFGQTKLDYATLDFRIRCRPRPHSARPIEYSIELFDDCCLRIERRPWLQNLLGSTELSRFSIDEKRLVRAVKRLAMYTNPGCIAKGQSHFNKAYARTLGEYHLYYKFVRRPEQWMQQLELANPVEEPDGAMIPLQKPMYG